MTVLPSTTRVSDTVLLPGYLVAVAVLMPAGAVAADWYAAVRALCGMVALLTMFFGLALAYPNGVGFSDVKLAGLIGFALGWLSWNALFIAAAGTLLIACLGGTLAIVTRHATRNLAVPLGPCLVCAAALTLVAAGPISTWYGSLLPI